MKEIENYDNESTILLNNNEYHNISLNEPICLYGKDIILKELLDNLLTNKTYYNKILSIAKSKSKFELKFAVNKKNKFYEVSSISLRNIIRYFEKNEGILIKIRINKIKKLMDYKNLLEQNNKINFNIENKIISIEENDLIKLLILDKKEFINFINKLCINYQITKEELLYILKDYVTKNNIFQKYYFNNQQIYNFNEETSYLKNDYESINKYLTTEDSIINKYELSKDLSDLIIKNIPSNYSLLEKSIYVYFKLCTILTYDEESFILNSLELRKDDKKEIERLSKIDAQNNQILCYEFTSIYGKLLNLLGINYHIESTSEEYGYAHSYLTYRVEKYIIQADAVTSVLKGDISNIKIGNPPNGIECKNMNIKSILEFEKDKVELYKIVREEYLSKKEYKKDSVSLDTFKKLRGINSNIKNKIIFIVDQLHKSNMQAIDKISYLLTLKKQLFSSEELENNINICILYEHINNNEIKTVIILTINNIDYYEDNNKYFILDDKLIEITKEELTTLFDSKKYEYINNSKNRVPGIYNENMQLKYTK